MEFSGLIFLWVFLPLTLAVCFGVRLIRRGKDPLPAENGLLLAFSLLFYVWGGLKTAWVLPLLTMLSWGLGRAMGEPSPERKGLRKALLAAGIVCEAGLLLVFKYRQMPVILWRILTAPGLGLKGRLLALLSFEKPADLPALVLPLAVSFLTFQSIAYLTDVYRGKAAPEKKISRLALFLAFFPQLVQGPILRYGEFAPQLSARRADAETVSAGLGRYVIGLGKKVLIADTLAEAAGKIWGEPVLSLGTGEAWLGLLLFTLQIYYDFSGYSDMAVGLGKLFGFTIPENFDHPYLAASVKEFWRRWHISLSSWFRDYLYIPLGGNRKGKGRTLLNLLIVFLATGLWHGANLTFLFWGLWFAVFLILERVFLGKWLEKNPLKFLNHLYALLTVMLGWVFFRSDSLLTALWYFRALFAGTAPAGSFPAEVLNARVLLALAAGILGAGFLKGPAGRLKKAAESKVWLSAAETLLLAAVLALCLLRIVGGSFQPSIYAAF